MDNFVRHNNGVQLFENISDDILLLPLKLRPEMKEIWEKNPNNTLPYDKLIDQISSMPVTVYFQKQRKDDTNNRLRQRLMIQIAEERAVEFRTSLWTIKSDAFSQSFALGIGKFREIDFFNEPNKDCIKKVCKIRLVGPSENFGSNEKAFTDLLRDIESLEIPSKELNKDKDQQIWSKYVEALKRLIKQKEQVWKIQRIGQSYSERLNQYSSERANYVEISINEKDIAEQFEKELRDYFGEEELDDYGVSDRSAFIEFKNFRELNDEEDTNVQEMAAKYFFMLSEESPSHSITGELKFKYSEEEARSQIIEQIKETLFNEYEIEFNIDETGLIKNRAKDIPHINKILENKFGYIASLFEDKRIHHRVEFSKDITIDYDTVTKVKIFCKEHGLERAYVKREGTSIIIEVGAYVPYDFLSSLGLVRTRQISRYGTQTRHFHYEEVEGTNLINGIYESDIVKNREESDKLLAKIKEANSDNSFRQKPSKYVFEIGQTEEDIEFARTFKSEIEIEDKVYFNLRKSDLVITPESEEEYASLLNEIKEQFPAVSIENKEYARAYRIQFGKGDPSQRENIINEIKSELRQKHVSEIEYDAIKNYTRVLLTYRFKSEEERENFKRLTTEIVSKYKSILDLSFETKTGTSLYQFVKNETLEAEKEKETLKNIRRATFIYMTEAQYREYQKNLERFGDSAFVQGTTQIGSFVRKNNNKFTFKLSEAFDKLLNSSFFVNGESLEDGYIKPIFPGEMTNIDRMLKAMNKVTAPGERRNGFPINRNLPNFIFDPTMARLSEEDLEEEKKYILSNLNENRLANQPKQLEAVAKAMLARDLALIQGPPGTGKTTVIAEIIWQTLSRNPKAKVLITSQTNLAVDNALERLKGKKLVRPIRIGKMEKFEDEGKVYSSDRLTQWFEAKANSKDENANSDNAISEWIKNVKNQCTTDPAFSAIVDKWHDFLDSSDKTIKEKFFNSYLSHINVFAATCSECGSKNFSEVYQQIFQKGQESMVEPEFDVVIMDEASKATPPELILPLTLGKKVIIIGDHKQLPPMIDENEFSEALEAVGAKKLVEDWTKQDYKISQFEKLFVNAPEQCVASLDTQFRMHRQIMDCISQFYRDQKQLQNGLICGIEGEMDNRNWDIKGSRWHGMQLVPFIDHNIHAIWINVKGNENRVGTSYENIDEIEAIKIVLKALTKTPGFAEYYSHFAKEEEKEIGIITYYMPQMQKIKSAIYPTLTRDQWRNFELYKYENEYKIPFRINTVDRFQGMERNIIIISTVRSDLPKDAGYKYNKSYPFALGFAREIPRVNVGFSRAKSLLIVIGNKDHFAHKPEYNEAIKKMHSLDIEQLINL